MSVLFVQNSKPNSKASLSIRSYFVLFVLFLISFSPCTQSRKVYPQQAPNLLQFRDAIDSTNTILTSWQQGDDCEQYQGVTCNDLGQILSINLANLNLSGEVADVVTGIDTLQSLTLDGNNLQGSIPFNIGNLKYLEILSIVPVYGTKGLKGTIPPTIGNCTNLKSIYLQHNQLEGPIPNSIGNLVNLEILVLSENYLTSITNQIQNLKELKELNLAQNLFTGKVPDTFGKLTKLEKLDLFGNFFEGSIPNSFKNLIHLQKLTFINNRMNGTIPNFFGKFSNLTILKMDRNNFSGSIPSIFGNLTNLQELQLDKNSFTGSLPSSIGNLKNLTGLYVSDNFLSGKIPSSLGKLNNLLYLYLFNNSFTGSIPDSFGNLSNLISFDVHLNKLSGRLPENLKNLQKLYHMDLSNNSFFGYISKTYSNLNQLQVLDISNNNFFGNFGFDLYLNNLTILSMKNCKFKKISLQNFPNLRFIDASKNKISGNFNFSFSKTLESLQLSDNKLFGKIILPNYYSSALSEIVLDNNNFTGNFPKNFKNFKNLTFASFLKNNLKNFSIDNELNNKNNLSIILYGNPLCSHNSVDLQTHNSCEIISPKIYAEFPYDNISNAEIAKNLNLAQTPTAAANFACKNFCSPPFFYSPVVFARTAKCFCTNPLQISINLFTPPFSVFTLKDKEEIERNIANFFNFQEPSRAFVHSIYEKKGRKIMRIHIYPPNPDDVYFPLYLAPAVNYPFKRSNRFNVIGVKYGPFAMVSTSLTSIMEREIERQKIEVFEFPQNTEKKKKINSKLIIIIASMSAFIAFIIIIIFLIILYTKAKNKRKEEEYLSLKEAEKDKIGSWDKDKSQFRENRKNNFIPLSEIIHATDNFSKSNLIGSGGYGHVYKGESTSGQLWAIKRSKICSEKALKNLHTEVSVISKMSHKNIVQLLGYCDEEGEQILVYEFIPNGTLKQNIKSKSLSFKQRVEIAFGSAQALNYLHSFAKQTILHRDIKSDNILLDANFESKLADFGLLKYLPDGEKSDAMSTRVAGTPGYLDPEYYKTFKVTSSSDVYSFGVVLLELVTGKPPVLDNMTPMDESYIVTVGKWALPHVESGMVEEIMDPTLKDEFSKNSNPEKLLDAIKSIAELASKCMQKQGKNRPKMEEVAWKLGEIRNSLDKKIEEVLPESQSPTENQDLSQNQSQNDCVIDNREVRDYGRNDPYLPDVFDSQSMASSESSRKSKENSMTISLQR